MTRQTLSDLVPQFIAALGRSLRDFDERDREPDARLGRVSDTWGLANALYQPDEFLRARIRDYDAWKTTGSGEEPGPLMEEIAFLAFRCLPVPNSIKSYQSYSAQHDLTIEGSSPEWYFLIDFLHLPTRGRTIVVEAKNLDDRVDDAQFSRLCGILQNKFSEQCHLGVFVSRSTATGFPKPEEGGARVLRDAYATQILFHAKTGKYVVLLDDADIHRLVEPGALPRLLEAKIRHVEEAGSLSVGTDEGCSEVQLPPHLARYQPGSVTNGGG